MAKGQIEVEVLEDGRLVVNTGDMSGPNHKAADEFLKLLQTLMGGEVETEKTKHAHGHHAHTHDHKVGHTH